MMELRVEDFLLFFISQLKRFNIIEKRELIMAEQFKLDIIRSRINLNANKKFNFDFTMYHEPYVLDENLNRVNQYASLPTLTY